MLHAATNLFAVSPHAGPDGDMTVALVALGLKVLLAAGCLVHLSCHGGVGRGVPRRDREPQLHNCDSLLVLKGGPS